MEITDKRLEKEHFGPLTLGMHRVSSVWPIALDRVGPFFHVKCHRCAYGVSPLRMATCFDCATNRNRRCCVSPHFGYDDVATFVVGIVNRQVMASSCQMLQTKYERYGHHPCHCHRHDRMVAIQNL